MRRLVLVPVVLLAVTSACADDETTGGTGGAGGEGGADTRYLAIAMVGAANTPFVARAELLPNEGGPARFYLREHRFLRADDRTTPVGEVATYAFGPDGQAAAELEVVPQANPIDGRAGTLDLIFTIEAEAPRICGRLSGTADFGDGARDLTGSTFAITPAASWDPDVISAGCEM